MASITGNKNGNQQRSESGTTRAATAIQKGTTQTFKNGQETNDKTRQEEVAKRTKNRRPTKVGLNDTLRRIRHLIVDGRSNLEIQDILQLEERTFYRYMARIYEIDQALFAEQEKKTITTETAILKDRWLKSYRWYIAIADNENIKADIRMEAQRNAAEMALTLLKLELEGPTIIRQEGFVEKLYPNDSQL
jgi:DNA-binding CsgD family transcriptional regulator